MSINIFNPNNSWSQGRSPEMHRSQSHIFENLTSRSRKFSSDSPTLAGNRREPAILIKFLRTHPRVKLDLRGDHKKLFRKVSLFR